MIREIKKIQEKYIRLQKKNIEYVSIGEVTNDLYQLIREIRLKRLPKLER
jgi:hypothetical protein